MTDAGDSSNKQAELQAELAQLRQENATLRQIISRRTRRSTVLARMNSRIHLTPELPHILQTLAEEIGYTLDAARCFIDLDVDLPSLPSFFEYRAPAASSLEKTSVATWPFQHDSMLQDCHLVVPIMLRHELMGTIGVQFAQSREGAPDEVELVMQTAGGLAMLLTNVRLLLENQLREREIDDLQAEMQQRASALETLLSFSADLNEQLDPDSLIRRLVEHAASLVGAQGGLGGLLESGAMRSRGYWQAGRWRNFQAVWTANTGLAGWVLAHKRPYLSNDYEHEPQADRRLRGAFNVVNALCVPILDADNQALGFFEVHNKAGGREPFGSADANMLHSLANAAAVAIRNSRLFAELETQRTQLRALSAQLVTRMEDERRRIARELHDEAGQALVGIKLNLQLLAHQIPLELPELREEGDRLRQQVNQATERLQALSRGLRPPTLDELGLEAAMRRLTADFEQSSSVIVHLEVAELANRLPQPLETSCYRIVQEALTNVARHAHAGEVWVQVLRRAKTLHLSVADDGRGFDPVQARRTGLGLLGMQERATMLGGRFLLETAPGAGTTVKVVLPLADQDFRE